MAIHLEPLGALTLDGVEAINKLKEQLLIIFLKRLGGIARIPVSEVDDTGSDMFEMWIDGEEFIFKLSRKH